MKKRLIVLLLLVVAAGGVGYWRGWFDFKKTDTNEGKTNVMPAQSGRLTPAQIHLLASYVWSLSQVRPTALQ